MSGETSSATAPVRSFPENLSRRWHILTRGDVIMLAVLYFAYRDAIKFSGNVAGFFVVFTALVVMTPLLFGRVYTYAADAEELLIKYVLHDKIYDANDTSWRRFLRRALPTPGVIDELGDKIALLYSANHTDTAIITGEGSGLLGLNFDEQDNLYRRVERIIRHLAASTKLSIGIGWLYRTRPPDLEREARQNHFTKMHGEVIAPRALDPDRPIGPLTKEEHLNLFIYDVSADNFQARALCTAETTEALVLRVQRSSDLTKAIKKGEITDTTLGKQPIAELVETATDALKGVGVVNPHVLNAPEMKRFIRRSYDIVGIDAFDELSPDVQSKVYGPQNEVIVKWKSCCIDGSWHATFMITQALDEVAIWDLRQLYWATSDWLSVAIPSETVGYQSEYQWINFVLIPFTTVFRSMLSLERQGEAGRINEQKREERQRTIYRARFAQHISALLSVHTASEEELEVCARYLRSAITEIGLSCTRVKRRRLQVPALWAAATCGDIL